MEYHNIILEKEDDLAILFINRPRALNALNAETLYEIDHVIEDVKRDTTLKALIITGAGDKAFVAGGDISSINDFTANKGRFFSELGEKIFRKLENMEKPVIAAINGFALGAGCELAMACDIRLAADIASLGLPEVSLGIIPGFGGTQRLPRLVGEGIAKELTFTAGIIDAEEAYRIGLVNHVYPAEQLMEKARKLAGKILNNSPLAVGYAKCAIGQGLQVDIDAGMRIEADLFGMCCVSEDKAEGVRAFMEKRKANFKGQ